ncbi:MAG: ATP-binding protein [Candidatus Peribacteraceae bacterium]|nr:ATP-binding protein [Candidatus Peribacteraceae bacterium]
MKKGVALPEELRILREAVRSAKDHVIVTDATGLILFCNAAAERRTGFSEQEMVGRKPGELWGGHMSQPFYAAMWKVLRDHGQSFVGVMFNRTKDGRGYWQEVHIIPIVDAEGEPAFFLGIEFDVEDEQKREELMREVEGRLVQSRVQWPKGWLLESGKLSVERLAQLSQHYGQEGRADLLLDDLLALTGVEVAMQYPDEEVLLAEVVGALFAEAERLYPGRAYRSDGDQTVRLTTKRVLLVHILRRIILNAAQYTATGEGHITVAWSSTSDGSVILRCTDNGIGIPLEEQPTIFEKYVRGSNAYALHSGGSGLGLYIVKMAAGALGWEVKCMSSVGKGTTMELRIPPFNRAREHVLRGGKVSL